MQTFLIDKDLQNSSQLLDYRRLGKQRVEAIQVADVLLRKAGLLNDGKKGWINHVVLSYWYNEEGNWLPALLDYTQVTIDEWISRGYKNTIDLTKWRNLVGQYPYLFRFDNPPWAKYADEIILTHRAKLLQKDTVYYMNTFMEHNIAIPFNWQNMEYKWLTELKSKQKQKI
jgi:hypothetical protein